VAHDRPRQSEAARLVRPDHFRRHLEIVAAAPSARDRARKRGVVDAIPDEGFIDMDGNDLADVAFADRAPGERHEALRRDQPAARKRPPELGVISWRAQASR
jgi:hypothetical protein